MASKSRENKTQPTALDPADFIASIDIPVRKADAEVLLDWFQKITGFPPVMWGSSMIGYGRYHYVYDSGRSGDSLMTGFSARKASLTIYTMPGYQDLDSYLQRLGKHKVSKSCLYVNKLADIDMQVLEEIVRFGVRNLQDKYETWPK